MTVKSGFLENVLCFQKFLNRFEGLWKYWILNSKKGLVLSNIELNPFKGLSFLLEPLHNSLSLMLKLLLFFWVGQTPVFAELCHEVHDISAVIEVGMIILACNSCFHIEDLILEGFSGFSGFDNFL